MKDFLKITSTAIALAAFTSSAQAATSFFDVSGAGSTFGPLSNTTSSVIVELTFDFTTGIDGLADTKHVTLFEAGGNGSGTAIVLRGDNIYYFAGDLGTDVALGAHGLSSPTLDVQVLGVFEVDGGTGGNDLLSLYVDGALITTSDTDALGDWAGGDVGALGARNNSLAYDSSTLFAPSNTVSDNVAYSGGDISASVYLLGGENTVENILVPEPGSAALVGLSGLLLLGRRRR